MAKRERVERVYTIPLGKALVASRKHRVNRAVNIIKEFASRHMKTQEVKLSPILNEFLWENSIEKPPRRVTVKIERAEDGTVSVSLP